jgi:hypothetical protein
LVTPLSATTGRVAAQPPSANAQASASAARWISFMFILLTFNPL